MPEPGPFAAFGHDWASMVDATADWAVDLLRRTAGHMADGIDRDAMRDIEGSAEWRDLNGANRHAR